MFEKIKGVKKGQTVAEQTSKATMNVVNHLITGGKELKTHETLAICSYFYFYSLLLVIPTNSFLALKYGKKANKIVKFLDGLDYQSKKLIEEWLQQTTGVYELDPYINELTGKFWDFIEEIIEKYSLGDGPGAYTQVKSYSSEEVLNFLCYNFENNSSDFKNCIGKQLESMRIALS